MKIRKINCLACMLNPELICRLCGDEFCRDCFRKDPMTGYRECDRKIENERIADAWPSSSAILQEVKELRIAFGYGLKEAVDIARATKFPYNQHSYVDVKDFRRLQ